MHIEAITAGTAARRILHARGTIRSVVTDAAHELNQAAARRGCIDLGNATQDAIDQDTRERAEWIAKQGRGRRPQPYAEILFAGPPQYADERAWDEDKETRWAKATVAWVKSRFPDSLLVVASWHRDETSPHIHVVISPKCIDGDGDTHYGYCQARNETVLRYTAAARKQATKPKGGKAPRLGRKDSGKVMSALQTDYHQSVGAKFGLARGVVGSKAQHKAVDEMKSAKSHIKEAKAELRQVGAKLKAARRQAAKHAKQVAIRERAIREREEAHGNLDEREDQLVEQTNNVTQSAIELAEVQRQHRAWAESLERRERGLERKAESLAAEARQLAAKRERLTADDADAANTRRRIDVATKCLEEAAASVRDSDMNMWQDHAHEALHGDIASIERIFDTAKTTEHERQHRQTRRRRRRRPGNVVDFRRSG